MVQGRVETLRDALLACLPAAGLGRPLHVYRELASTSDHLKDLAQTGSVEGTTVLALAQTRGRGRRGRAWHSPPGLGLYLSVLLRPEWPAAEAGWLGLVGGLAAARAVERLGVRGGVIKHPNDVLVAGRKIAGVLIEPRVGAGHIEYAVVGIGLNVAHAEADWLGSPVEGCATSCAMEGVSVPLERAAAAVLGELQGVYRESCCGPRTALLEEWTRRGGRAEVP